MLKIRHIFLLILIALNGCAQKSETMTHKYTNALIDETSPYLLQHAHNPVNWEAWKPEVLERARKEGKLMIISIGYAACHWCHVMEKECFEDEEVATLMNKNFINIKIDREERPDIDHIYMDALQMMTGSGGWPLNVVTLPDGRPFWGATYVKKDEWIRVLGQLIDLYEKDPQKITEYAANLASGIQAVNLVTPKEGLTPLTAEVLDNAVKKWAGYFDNRMGGYNQAPKFMMPGNLDFLLHYGVAKQDEEVLEYVNNTLTKMAYGGIFDHIGGGFSRYSVDKKWHVPHFEKMLYDNGQLVSLYAKAYAATGNELYKKVVEETVAFVQEELMDTNYSFYSSLDADSNNEHNELEEGAFYVWKKEELQQLLGDKFDVFKDYYNIGNYGLWEEGKYVLIRDETDKDLAKEHGISLEDLRMQIEESRDILKSHRSQRSGPRLDDKVLTSWNGLMLKGLVDAYKYLEDKAYLDLALKNATFLKNTVTRKDGGLYHNHKDGKNTINGYLEDYASVIDAYTGLYEVTFDEQWLFAAKDLIDYCLRHFYDTESGLFFFTSKDEDFLIRRTVETSDNVVPASNSIMAKNLFKMSRFFPDETYEATALKMLAAVQDNIPENAQGYANWLHLILYTNNPFYEVAVVGDDFRKKARFMQKNYTPNAIYVGSDKSSELSLLQNRLVPDQTLIYVCQHGSCKLPVSEPEKALKLVR